MPSRPPRRIRAALAAGRPITVESLRNPMRVSGYDMVGTLGNSPNGHGQKGERYRAQFGVKGGKNDRGPARRTAEEAAQDYCVFANSGATPESSIPRYPDIEIDMGNTKRHAPKPEKVTVVREKFKGPHDLYDVLFITARGDIMSRKIGITARGHARYADFCKTFGLSIVPFNEAITFPSEEAATVAETAKIEQVAGSLGWRRIGKESFAPVGASTHWVMNQINARKAAKAA